VEQRQLERARPCPELPDGQWRDRLERVDEAMESLRVEAARAVPYELPSHRVDPRKAGELVRGDGRQPTVERGWKIVSDVAGGGRDRVEVVEQPFGGGRRGLAPPRVVRQIDVHAAQHAHVIIEPV